MDKGGILQDESGLHESVLQEELRVLIDSFQAYNIINIISLGA